MEGTRLITLLEPVGGGKDAYGQDKPSTWKRYPVWAVRKDTAATEGYLGGDNAGVEWLRDYEIRKISIGNRTIKGTWRMIDEDGEDLNIKGVFEVNSGARERRLKIKAAYQGE